MTIDARDAANGLDDYAKGPPDVTRLEDHLYECEQGGDGRFYWHCVTCTWSGRGCPSADFASREHADIATQTAREGR